MSKFDGELTNRGSYTPPRNIMPPPPPVEMSETRAKLSERKTVHEWLNTLGIPNSEHTGKRMCLLRRLAVALKVQPYACEPNPTGLVRESASVNQHPVVGQSELTKQGQ